MQGSECAKLCMKLWSGVVRLPVHECVLLLQDGTSYGIFGGRDCSTNLHVRPACHETANLSC